MKLKNGTIEDWLKNPPKNAFHLGKRIDYYSLYIALKTYLENNVHKQVNYGANLKDPDILINDHGIDHVNTVIEKASELISCNECKLTAFEIYILLLCIQLHDVGNIFGRYNHELNIEKIMSEAKKLCGRDVVEMITIKKIAQAHGGEIRGVTDKKDTISVLREKEALLDGEIHKQAIAGILRFADELSDDKRRAFATLLKENKIPKKSEVFHAYASCLDAAVIKHNEKAIELNFKIPKEFAIRSFGKMDTDILLLDEIYNRSVKMHLERIYCMRFLKRIINIEKITVLIKFYDKYLDDIIPISFELCESGYPKVNSEIYDLCPSLHDRSGNKITGEYIKNKIGA